MNYSVVAKTIPTSSFCLIISALAIIFGRNMIQKNRNYPYLRINSDMERKLKFAKEKNICSLSNLN
ncbi:hypothetical protein HZS_4450 [Henneguya salminicola]|nr:hypothetical protein HZS_4450 [Henneguya salminicola]